MHKGIAKLPLSAKKKKDKRKVEGQLMKMHDLYIKELSVVMDASITCHTT
jgi:hypothetical protein